MPESVRFSVVTPTHGRPSSLQRMLNALGRQTYPSDLFEVIVVVDGHDGRYEAALENIRFPFRLRVLTQEQSGPAAARNRALEHASEPFALFIDDDVLPSSDLLAQHAGSHGEPDVAVIGTLVAARDGGAAPWTRWEWATLEKQYRAMLAGEWPPTPRQFYTGNASVALDAVRGAGGFNPNFRRAEDVELAWRLQSRGIRFVFNPMAQAEHYAQRSFDAWLESARQYGQADVLIERMMSGNELPGFALEEFQWRHRHTQLFTRAALRFPSIWRPLPTFGRATMTLCDLAHLNGPTRQLCSALFNAAYWHGVAQEVGGNLAKTLKAAEHPAATVAA